ncbi:hypothetical protein GCM10011515_14710 [Tsuneonella deserti]|uniref:Secreted protein n=1 Tax=Tsuneonella deserti TaxID=2035528 RepID=A0ABQ1S6P6_9SPHN|nr:hypothetical protein [Tsuneonella deserti]GGD95853.1 hypothetical protein GCM10011515_14710 [Tsuneonella deserti]
MNKLIMAGAAALAFAVPAAAQDMAVTSNGDVYVMTDAQQSMYDAWPPERQTMYTAWPDTYRTYYWTLTPTQQTGWWALTDAQRQQLYAMTPEQRATTWTSIERQLAGGPAGTASATAQTATTASTSAGAGNMRFVSNAVVQTTPAADNANTDYPPCKGDMQDHCINPREAGLKYGNVPLKYWPGRPASEIPGKKPQR